MQMQLPIRVTYLDVKELAAGKGVRLSDDEIHRIQDSVKAELVAQVEPAILRKIRALQLVRAEQVEMFEKGDDINERRC